MSCTTRALAGCVTMVLLVAVAAAQSVVPVAESGSQRLTGNPAPNLQAVADLGRVPDTLPLNHILLMLRRSAAHEVALDGYMRQQYDRHSRNYHRWLTPAQFGDQFGPTRTDIARVTGWLEQYGFTVNRVPAGGLFVDFSGDAGKVAQAFHSEIHRYRFAGADHYANATDPSIPALLAPLIAGFRALNDFHPRAQVRKPGIAHFDRSTGTWSRAGREQPHLTNPPGSASPLYIVGPQDFAAIYGINRVWQEHSAADPASLLLVGTGQTIGEVGETNLDATDIQSFRDGFGLTALGPHGSVQTENPPANVCAAPDPADNEPEGYVDAEWAGATAPDATIDYVACGRQGTTSGADLAAAYLIADPAHAARIAVLSTSYGDCETQPQSEANQFYVGLWQQAAAEGITVVVAAGDAGGDGCGGVYTHATDGLSVVNEASTPWNVAAGGTDFSDVFSGTDAAYWSATNTASDQSAFSYIPEMTWNDTCASPLVLAKFGAGFSGVAGPGGFCTYASQQAADPQTGVPPYFLAAAGGGGLSTVSARPPWQAGVAGIPTQGGRAVPDISMFAAVGATWSQALILCDSALVNKPAGSGCDFTNADDVFAAFDGGTSFVAPAFAGIVALINQKSGERQGQANYILYPLAAAQYSNSASLAACAAYLGPQVSDQCYFHDISATPNPAAGAAAPFLTGNTAIPCTGTATAPGTFTDTSNDPASNSSNCYGYEITVAQNGASLTTTPDYFGTLATADNAASSAFAAGPGYDLATGLGSPNVYALVNAPQWSSLSITTSGLPSGRVGIAYSQALAATGRVTPYSWSLISGSLPAGLSLATATGTIAGTPTAAGSSTFTVQVADPEDPPTAATATFTLVIAPPLVATATTLAASAPSVAPGVNVTFTATVSAAFGLPGGTVALRNGSATIATAPLVNGVATWTASFPAAGVAVLEADYSGDGTYAPSKSAPFTLTIAAAGFTATVNPAMLTVPSAGSGAVTVHLTPQGGFLGPVRLACGVLPADFSCQFGAHSILFDPSGASVPVAVTIGAAIPPSGTTPAAIVLGLGVLCCLRRQKRLSHCVLVCWSLVAIAGVVSCGGGRHEAPKGTYTVPIRLQAEGVPTQTLHVTVIVN